MNGPHTAEIMALVEQLDPVAQAALLPLIRELLKVGRSHGPEGGAR
jgi:hypothetical protein